MEERRVYMGEYRKIYKFSTPAGTPSLFGTGDTRLRNAFPLPDFAQHWGVFLHNPTINHNGYRDTYFELYRPRGGVGVLRRSRHQREEEEKENSKILEFTDTERITILTDEEIEIIGTTTVIPNLILMLTYW
jgi:hypothetical protein